MKCSYFCCVVLLIIIVPTISRIIKSKNPMLDGTIKGGEQVLIENYPYQLSLYYRGKRICGGALIDTKWVVTAAHCLDRFQKTLISIRTGSSKKNSDGQMIRVENAHIHPRYNPLNVDFDIAVLELKDSVNITTAKPVELPKEGNKVPFDVTSIATGWGTILGEDNDNLQMVRLPTISRDSCSKIYRTLYLTQRTFCAGYMEANGKDGCLGDTGSPLVINGVLYGIASWGYGCQRSGYPGVYANVPVLLRFIKTITNL